MRTKRYALLGGMVGISLISPYALSVLAARYPTSVFATFNKVLHQTPTGATS
jgi:hypothetical protein